MHIRSKFDGGKVINGSQSGSWELRCMGAGLQQNMGRSWGPNVWKQMAEASPNKVYRNTTDCSVKRVEKDRKRKATEKQKEADDEAGTFGLITQLQLAGLIADITKVLHLMKFLTTFLKST